MLAQKAVNVDDSDNSGASGASSANMDEAFLLIQQITANIVSYFHWPGRGCSNS